MGEELKECPFCEGTVSIAYHCAGNNLLYCQDCKRTFSERDAQIIKLNARIAKLERIIELARTFCSIHADHKKISDILDDAGIKPGHVDVSKGSVE